MDRNSIEFGERLIDAAKGIVDRGENSEDAGRSILYLGLLSCEIILKALLEKAGRPADEIEKVSHDLSKLLAELEHCEIEEETSRQLIQWVPATQLRGETIIPDTTFNVGVLLEGQAQGASKNPNGIRYGERIYLFPPVAVLMGAGVLLDWAHQNWDRIRCGENRTRA